MLLQPHNRRRASWNVAVVTVALLALDAMICWLYPQPFTTGVVVLFCLIALAAAAYERVMGENQLRTVLAAVRFCAFGAGATFLAWGYYSSTFSQGVLMVLGGVAFIAIGFVPRGFLSPPPVPPSLRRRAEHFRANRLHAVVGS